MHKPADERLSQASMLLQEFNLGASLRVLLNDVNKRGIPAKQSLGLVIGRVTALEIRRLRLLAVV